ncbi:hypothetical protein BGX34_007312 [Mortierella sp. NVP85]|nr:hypothetical protein BGX34_007312 [Mortierella sp. NVP85]
MSTAVIAEQAIFHGKATPDIHRRSKSLSRAHCSKTGYLKDSIDNCNGLGPKIDTTSVISIHVRYVPKDLWVQVDLPRNIPVHKARDIILAKCRLTFMPPQAHSTTPSEYDVTGSGLTRNESVAGQSHRDRATTNRSNSKDVASDTHWSQSGGESDSHHQHLSTSPESSIRTRSSNELLIPTKSRRPSRAGLDDESSNDQESMDDEEAELQAEELMADDLFPESPSSRTSLSGGAGFRDSMLKGLGDIDTGSPKLAQVNQHCPSQSQPQSPRSPSTRHPRSFGCNGDSTTVTSTEEHAALNHQQLQRLISYSLLHKGDENRHSSLGGVSSGGGGKDGSSMGATTGRISSHIPGWSHYRSRQSSQNARQMVREVLDHGGVLADSFGSDEMPKTETRMSECSAWKACFGLFWVAAGHWLDDSRLVSSYHLRPDCLLELQLRNNYIQLPPPGTSLSYYDHYAEGVLYKASKKNHRVATKLNGHGTKDSSSVWKERWVILQGTKLLIYHKRKDTTKKSIELQIPLTVVTTVIPQTQRQGFKISSSAVPMSSTMIILTTSSDPSVPKVCFRATSESELNHWVRIFNSLNSTNLQGLPPPFDPSVIMTGPIQVPPPLPPLPLEPPPISLDNAALSTKKKDRHHSFTAAATAACGRVAVIGGIATGGTPKDRRRCHTALGNLRDADTPSGFFPTIDPVLISNAAAAISNLQGSDGGSETGASDGGSTLGSRNSTIQLRHSDYGHTCVKTRSLPAMRSRSLKTSHQRDSTNSQSTLVGSVLNGADLSHLQHQSLSRHSSWSSRGQISRQSSGSEAQYALGNQVPLDTEGLLMRQNMRSMRMRTVTEPGQALGQASVSGQGGRIRSVNSYRSSTQSLLKEYIQRSKVNTPEPLSDAGSLTDENSAQDIKDLLNPKSQALLNISNTRSSDPPLYTGYIWLYIPNVSSTLFVKEGEQSDKPSGGSASVRSSVSSISSVGKNNPTPSTVSPTRSSGEKMQSATTTGITRANISITKASGQYVRCFVVINALGQFQWTEVSKNDQLSPQQRQEPESDVKATLHPSYGIYLSTARPQGPTSDGIESGKRMEDNGGMNRMLEGREGFFPAVQASMAHKLRLYFFCIKVTVSPLAEVMVEMLEIADTMDIESQNAGSTNTDGVQASLPSEPETETEPEPEPPRTSPIKIQNRFSTPLMHRSSSLSTSTSSSATVGPLLPSKTMSMIQKSKMNPQARHSVGNPVGARMRTSTTPGAVWPSMHPLFDRPQPPVSNESASASTPSPPLNKANVIQRTLSAPPPSTPEVVIVPTAESGGSKQQGASRNLLVKTQSLFVENRTRSKSPGTVFPTAGTIPWNKSDSSGSGEALSPSNSGSSSPLVVRTSGRMYGPESNVPAHWESVHSPVQESPKSETSISISSNALALAQDLQKAMRKGNAHPPIQEQQISDTLSNGNKLTLQEITAKKRASAQRQQNEANVAAARLKLVGGIKALDEACDDTGSIKSEQGHGSEEDRASVHGRMEKEQHRTVETTLRMLLKQCPFLEEGEGGMDTEGRKFVTLKGYTETEDEWKKLQGALEQFLGGPIKDQRSALPPEDTLIPSYHAPRLPEFCLSDKARKFLKAKDRAAAAAAAAAKTTSVHGDPQTTHAATTTALKDGTHSTTTTSALNTMFSQSSTGDMSVKPRSRVRSVISTPAPAEFSRYSVQLASGVGYGPRKSFIDPGSSTSDTSNNNSPSNAPHHFAEGYRSTIEENATRLRSGSGSLMTSGSPMTGLEASSFKARHQRTGSGNLLRSVLPHLQSEQQLTHGHTANGRGYGPMAQIKVTSANLTRWMQLATGSGDGSAIDRNSLDMSRKSVLGMEGLYAGGMEKSGATGD